MASDKVLQPDRVLLRRAYEFDAKPIVLHPPHHGKRHVHGRLPVREAEFQPDVIARLCRLRTFHQTAGQRQVEHTAFARGELTRTSRSQRPFQRRRPSFLFQYSFQIRFKIIKLSDASTTVTVPVSQSKPWQHVVCQIIIMYIRTLYFFQKIYFLDIV